MNKIFFSISFLVLLCISGEAQIKKPVVSKIIFKDRTAISFEKSNDKKTLIRYTLDGSKPTSKSPAYNGVSIHVAKSLTINAAYHFENGELSDFATINCIEEVDSKIDNNAPLPKATTRTNMPVWKNHIAKNTFDNNPETYFWAGVTPNETHYFILNFEEKQSLHSIEVITGKPEGGDSLQKGDLQISLL